MDPVMVLFNEADINLHRHCPTATLIIASMVGQDLNHYAYTEDVSLETKAMFDCAVVLINKEIVGINKRNWARTPWLAHQIHQYRGQDTFVAHYNKLSDGLNPTSATLRYWARSLAALMHRC